MKQNIARVVIGGLGLALLVPACGPKVHMTRLGTATIMARRPAPPPPPKVVDKIEINDRIEFKTGKATLLSRSYEVLDTVVDLLQNTPHIRLVEIGGHTDGKGKARRNRRLSQRRAAAVRAYLLDCGIEPERLVIKGYGPDVPLDDNSTAEGRRRNRRVEFTIVERGPEAQGG